MLNEEPQAAEEEGPRRYPSTIGGGFYIVVLLLTLAGVVVAAASDWRTGVRIIGGALAFAAVLRLVLRDRDAGMLAVRHRVLDIAILVLIAGALFLLAASIPDQPS
ncbi:MAG TPA: DUF3017 domain-containing protein [Nocardioides sp.]|nr:DUF3017 domain-containing protein [Nocardioides sp.]